MAFTTTRLVRHYGSITDYGTKMPQSAAALNMRRFFHAASLPLEMKHAILVDIASVASIVTICDDCPIIQREVNTVMATVVTSLCARLR